MRDEFSRYFNYFVYEDRVPEDYKNVPGIYFIITRGVKKNKVIYIGQSHNLYKRANRYWNKEGCDMVGIMPINEAFLYRLETAFIWKYKPKHNRNHQHGKVRCSYWAKN